MHIQRVLAHNGDPVLQNLEKLRQQCIVESEQSTRKDTYLSMNPDLLIHPVYMNSSVCVPDFKRVSFTQMRLSSHRLKVETGRWFRIPKEQRVCSCDNASVQDEYHVIFKCPKTLIVRQRYELILQSQSLKDIFEHHDIETTCNIMYTILKEYKQ